ncbi:MlaA family lipoprotein [Thiocapsa imhoffii]|nr:VacJ family lipoprotein [Thiocapsa imhoffii]
MILVPLLLMGCGSSPSRISEPRDPLEPFNRAVFRFNSDFDKAFLQPIAKGYRAITPAPVERGVTNFFANISDVTSVVNNILQFKMSRAGSDVGRLFINSTVGVFGFVDVATNVGLPSYKEDFGQTLGYWGLDSGAFIMLPFLGPSSVRDAFGDVGDLFTDPLFHLGPLYGFDEEHVYWGLIALRAVDRRANYLTTTQILEDAALDPYILLRDAYLQRRHYRVHDGNPPDLGDGEDFWDDIDFDD